ncbi:hypothetical protein BH11ACT6_BH11ACT6_54410 [soil metagenome]
MTFKMEPDDSSTAEMVLQLLEAGRFAEIEKLFVPTLRQLVSTETLRRAWEELTTTHGPITVVGTPLSESDGSDTTVVKIRVTCERGAFAVLMAVDQSATLHALQFAPPEAAEPVAPWQPFTSPQRIPTPIRVSLPRIGSICSVMTRWRWPRSWTSPYSSCKVAATTR